MSDIREARKALLCRILQGEGTTSPAQRRAAFDATGPAGVPGALVSKVVQHADSIDDADIASAKMSGLSEDQIFEIVVCAAVGQANRQYESALAALKSATKADHR